VTKGLITNKMAAKELAPKPLLGVKVMNNSVNPND